VNADHRADETSRDRSVTASGRRHPPTTCSAGGGPDRLGEYIDPDARLARQRRRGHHRLDQPGHGQHDAGSSRSPTAIAIGERLDLYDLRTRHPRGPAHRRGRRPGRPVPQPGDRLSCVDSMSLSTRFDPVPRSWLVVTGGGWLPTAGRCPERWLRLFVRGLAAWRDWVRSARPPQRARTHRPADQPRPRRPDHLLRVILESPAAEESDQPPTAPVNPPPNNHFGDHHEEPPARIGCRRCRAKAAQATPHSR